MRPDTYRATHAAAQELIDKMRAHLMPGHALTVDCPACKGALTLTKKREYMAELGGHCDTAFCIQFQD